MPCFHGLAVSIHTPDGPLPEYSIQKQTKFHRITSYIPVPPAKVPAGSTTNKPEQSTFAISITLLTPGLNVPYSTPKATPDDPYPRPKAVGGLPGTTGERGKYTSVIGPYVPLTASPNETIAAYIYFDGRAKEEVATLLRRGEETWVNSRWVSVPESEGGGLAEREFLFREVGLERWLNGLDLEGKDVAATIERRRQRLEKKRRKKKEREMKTEDDSDEDGMKQTPDRNGVLRYGEEKVEALSGDEGLFTSDSDSEDEPPMPEAAGQIKVALFRVLASGEIKRGEYSPQFDAHDDDEESGQNGTSGDGDVDHTTSFAKPKTLDPKSISTQTVTGIDQPDKPYAVFTFLYRGEKQLQKMGILADPEAATTSKTPAKQRSSNIDFSSLKPLNASTGVKNFAGYRDTKATKSQKPKKGKADDEMDSDADEDEEGARRQEAEEQDDEQKVIILSPDEAARAGEVEEGVRKMRVSPTSHLWVGTVADLMPQLKRQHSAEPVSDRNTVQSPGSASPTKVASPPPDEPLNGGAVKIGASAGSLKPPEPATSVGGIVGSPYKKQRASLPNIQEPLKSGLALNEVLGQAPTKPASESPSATPAMTPVKREDEDEEL